MTQTLVPIDDITSGQWVAVGAANEYLCIDETLAGADDDTTYLSRTAAAMPTIWLGHVTAAVAPATTGGIVFGVRARERGPGLTSSLLAIDLRSDADGTIATRALTVSGTIWATTTWTLTVAEEALITDWPNLRGRIALQSTSALQVRVTAYEVTLPDPPPNLNGWWFPMWKFT